MTDRIGFIGVGLMGHGMAKNILAKGYPARDQGQPQPGAGGRPDRARRDGGDHAGRARTGVGHRVPLRDGLHRRAGRLLRPRRLRAGAHPGLVIVDCSTSDPTVTLRLAEGFAEVGVTFCDAPLGGVPAQAEEGKLSCMVGADEATFARIEPVLRTWAVNVKHIGPVGTGHKMKLVNNLLALGYGALYAEALTLAAAVGVTPQVFDSVIRGSRMDCGYYQTFFRAVLEGDRDAHQFTVRNAYKDMRYVEAMAQAATVANPIGNAVKNSYAQATTGGLADEYMTRLPEFIAGRNGVTLESS